MSDGTQNTEQKAPEEGTSTTSAATETQPSTETEKPEKTEVTFTPEQQAAIDKIIGDKLGKVKERTAAETLALQKQIEERDEIIRTNREREESLQREKDEKERKRLEEKGEFEKLAEMDRQRAESERKKLEEAKAAAELERDNLRKKLEVTKIDNELLAAFAADAVDPDAAVQLFKNAHNVTLDPSTMNVVIDGDTDTPLQSKARDFLATRDYLSKSKYAGKSGAGSNAGGSATGAPGTYTRAQLNDLEFYRAHTAELDKAVAEGRIVD